MWFFYATLAFLLCFVLVPTVCRLSWTIGAIDVPKDWRRMHAKKIPRAGGVAVCFAFSIATLALGGGSHSVICALGGYILMTAVGLADDIYCFGAQTKLLFQISIVTASVLGLGKFSATQSFFAIFWVLTLCNAHNFIDGLDGLLCGCAMVEGGFLSVAMLLSGQGSDSYFPLLLSAACLAFLHFNRAPANIFAGDCGSLSIGFLLGMLSLGLFERAETPLSLLSPLFIFAYPLTDLFVAVVRRLLRGRSPFSADRAHLHHRLCDAGLSKLQSVHLLHLICAMLGGIGVLLQGERFFLFASLFCVITAVLLIKIRHFVTDFI